MNETIVLQARTSSSRLPAKVLLPVKGIPLAVLAAKRAANTGMRVVVATSTGPSDNALCAVLADWDIPFYRGSLNDVLQRFLDALSGLEDEHVIVRLTGDNVLPDGSFIREMLDAFYKENKAYLCCVGEESGLPYGLSAEITRLKHLREAHQKTVSMFDREHVTPWVKRHYGVSCFQKYSSVGMGHYRCTVDTFDDYQTVLSLFEGFSDIVNTNFLDLAKQLKLLPFAPIVSRAVPELILGTAQLGMKYGIANTTGMPAEKEAESIIKNAICNGIVWLDTARAYGASESVIGKALEGGWQSRVGIITKLHTLDDCPEDASDDVVKAFVERSVFQSCHALQKQSLDVLMLHRASCLNGWEGKVWRRLLKLREEGIIGSLGVSVQNPEELLLALSFKEVSFIQLPFNILDHRWHDSIQSILNEKQQRNLTVHVRSVYLQGLLLSDSEALWQKANCRDYKEIRNWLMACREKTRANSISHFCIRYAASQPWLDGLVVGVESRSQLEANIQFLDDQKFSIEQLREIEENRPVLSEKTLNPALWQK